MGKICNSDMQMNIVWELGSRTMQTQTLPLRGYDLKQVA